MVLFTRGRKKQFKASVITPLTEGKDIRVVNILKCYCRDKSSTKLSELTDSSQATLLHYAAEHGNPGTVEYLLGSQCEIEARDHLGRSPLMLAATGGHENVVRVLLKANANINLTNSQGKNTLDVIFKLKRGRFPMLKTFFKYAPWQKIIEGIIPDELVKKLDRADYTPKDVLQWGNAELMKAVLADKNVNDFRDPTDGETLLHLATKLRETEMAKVLLQCGADVDALDCWKATPLFYVYHRSCTWAWRDDNLEIFKVIMSRATLLTTSIDDGSMQISCALQCGSAGAIGIILQSNVDLNTTDTSGNSVLHYLSENRNVDLFQLLRGRTFNANALNGQMCSPLHVATRTNSFESIKFLLENEADANAVNKSNKTPLYITFERYGNMALCKQNVEILLEYGADPQKYALHYTPYRLIIHRCNTSGQPLASAEPFLARLAVLQGLGTEITDRTRSEINLQSSWVEYFDACQRQVERMRETTINGNVKLFDFLTDSQRKMTAYVRNEELVSKLEKAIEEFEEGSPYRDMLRRRLAKATEWAELKDKAITAILRLIDFKNNIHYFAAGYIVEYLSNRDMDNLHLIWND